MKNNSILKWFSFGFLGLIIFAFNTKTNSEIITQINADTLNLSQYKDKIVVLNYWASWSKISRSENKNLTRIYNKYKNNPKIVFISVSLDTDESNWKNAIEEDGLVWTNHFCDFKKYDSPLAKRHQITTLPTILVLKNNKIEKTAATVIELESIIEGFSK